MENRFQYSVSDAFSTFPAPGTTPFAANTSLESVGKAFYEGRADYMAQRNEGLTKFYNAMRERACMEARIVALRRLTEDMDRAVLEAYGWQDIEVPPYDISHDDPAWEAFEGEILDRLFALNGQRAAEEGRPIPLPSNSTPALAGRRPGRPRKARARG